MLEKLDNKSESISILDLIIIFIKNKIFLLSVTFFSMIIFYLAIYFFVEEQFDSTATIVPSNDNSISSLSGMLGDLGGLPFGLGSASNPEVGLYNTIFSSRTTIDSVIERFNLWQVYDLDKNKPKKVKKMRELVYDIISTEETEDGAYTVSVRTKNSYLSAEMVNFLIDYLNNKIISLKVDKSKNNRQFLEKRVNEIRNRLSISEDSLIYFQQTSGILSPEEQVKGIITTYAKLEQDLMLKKLQKDVLEKIYGTNSPQLERINIEVELFEEEFIKLKNNGKNNSFFISYSSIPNKLLNYYRYYREVEINQTLLKFILPLYEQSKIDEQKKIPILQVIDKAIPEEVKTFPPRAILTLIVGFGVFVLLFAVILVKENKSFTESEKITYITKNIFKLRNRE